MSPNGVKKVTDCLIKHFPDDGNNDDDDNDDDNENDNEKPDQADLEEQMEEQKSFGQSGQSRQSSRNL